MNSHRLHFRLLLFILLTCTTIQAAIETFNGRIYSATGTLLLNASVNAVDNSTGSFVNYKAKDYFTLAVDHDNLNYVASSYNLDFHISYTYIDGSAVTHTGTTVLNIAYEPNSGLSYKDKSVFVFTGGYDIAATIDYVYDAGTTTPATIPSNLYLEAKIEVERYYTLTTTAPAAPLSSPVNLDGDAIPDELEVSWAVIPGAEEYELEWTYVNDYDNTLSVPMPISSLTYNFRGNSTRITTTQNHYNISLVFERGYVVYRIRGVGRNASNLSENLFGQWSLVNSGNVSDASKYYVAIAHQKDKNWQYSATYAEEGKKKELVSYFDGSLRNRQTVSKTNTNNQAIVGETIYDHQGRGAVQALPAPTNSPVLSYYPGFSLQMGSTASNLIPYTREYFDKDAGACNTQAEEMSTLNGASRYYSPNNPDLQNQQAYVPDANKYPFTQVEYEPDNTGRIKRQSGVGIDHQLGSGHETSYFYGKPLQEELDRLFGSEAGDAAHYKKNMVMDANGQISVSYLDQQGRVIATALAGTTVANMVALESSLIPNASLTADLFCKNANGKSRVNVTNQEETGIIFTDYRLVSTAGDYTFNYSTTLVPAYTSTCTPTICFDCSYNLELTITDECGAVLYTHTQFIGNPTTDLACNVTFPVVVPPFTLNLPVGAYKISKKLTIDNNALDYYLAQYLDPLNNSCIKTLQDFTVAAMANIDFSGCDITCEECVISLGADLAEYQTITNDAGATQADFDKAIAVCRKPCEYDGSCEAAYLSMLSDVSPGGQYAQYKDENNNFTASIILSIFNANNKLPKRGVANNIVPYWQKPINQGVAGHFYRNDDGTPSLIDLRKVSTGVYDPAVVDNSSGNIIEDAVTGQFFTYPENLLNANDFINRWQASWAKALVEYHPEYAYYQWCNGNSFIYSGATLSSEGFDELMYNTNTLIAAKAANLVSDGSLEALASDPYFLTGGFGSDQNAAMAAKLANYNNGKSLKQFVYITNHCGTIYNNAAVDDCINSVITGSGIYLLTPNDWLMYRNLYMAEKQKFQEQQATIFALNNTSFNGCIGDKNFDPFVNGMDITKWANADEPCGYASYLLYVDKTKRFRHSNDITDDIGLDGDGSSINSFIDDYKNQIGYELYMKTGQCPLALDLQSLLNKLSTNNVLLQNTDLTNYPEFTNALYSSVGGSPTAFSSFSWMPGYSSTVLTGTFNNGTNNCSTAFTIPSGGGFTWAEVSAGTKKIVNLQQLEYVQENPIGTYQFKITATIDNLIGTPSSTYTVSLSGTTCVVISGCTFNNVCSPSILAKNLQTLMSGMANQGQLTNTAGVGIGLTYLSPSIIANLGQSGSWYWKNTTGRIFEIYDPTNGLANKIKIDFSNVLNNGIDFSSIQKLGYISSINGASVNTFSVVAYVNISSVITPKIIIGTASLMNGTTTLALLNMGTCGLPIAASDRSTSNIVRGDLENFLNTLAVKTKLTSTVSSPYNLTYEPAFTDMLRSGFGAGSLQWTSVLASTSTNKTFTGTIQQTDETASCNIKLNYAIDTNDPCYFTTFTFASVTGFSGLVVDESNLLSGKAYNFSINAHLIDETIVVLSGTSCYALTNCSNCDNLVVNGDFEAGNTGFTSNYTYVPSFTTGQYGKFTVNDHAPITPAINPDKILSGKFLMLQDDITWSSTIPHFDPTYPPIGNPQVVWSSGQPITVIPNTDYVFSVWVRDNLRHDMQPYDIVFQPFFRINGYSIEEGGLYYGYSPFLQSFSITTSYQPGNWIKHAAKWNSENNTSVTLDILHGGGWLLYSNPEYNNYYDNIETFYSIDNISFKKAGCSEIPDSPPYFYESPTEAYVNPCEEYLTGVAIANATYNYNQYIDNVKEDFKAAYKTQCLSAPESFTMNFVDKEYHYTLYYYDQGGNLVRTVPPNGVKPVTLAADFTKIKNDRTNGTHTHFMDHSYVTNYNYNSLNQLVNQSTPDQDNLNKFELTPTPATSLPPGFTANDIQFTSGNNAYLVGNAAGEGNIYSSSDGGKTWTMLTGIGTFNLKKIQLLDANTGYAIGADGKLFKSTNASAATPAWATIAAGITTQINDLYFADAQNGIIAGDNGLVKITNNAGDANPVWAIGTGITGNITGITFPAGLGSTATGYASVINGAKGQLYITTNGGATWMPQKNIRSNNLNSIYFIDANNGFAAGIDGTLLKTTNRGITWLAVATGTIRDFKSIYFKDANTGCAIMQDGSGSKLWSTTNGGATWALTGPAETFNDLHFYSSGNGYAAGSNGSLQKTTNAGATWSNASSSPSAGTIFSVYFVDAINGFAFAGSALFKTNDGAASWTGVTLPSGFPISEHIINMHFTDINNGVVLTDAGNIYSLPNAQSGSPAWTLNLSGYTGMHFYDANNGYAITSNGATSATTNGGLTWSTNAVSITPSSTLKAVFAQSPTEACAVGNNGDIFTVAYTTSNNWLDQSINVKPLPLNDIHAVTASLAYTVGNDGTVLKTTDGNNWKEITSVSAANLNAVKFYDASNGLAVGNGGAIIKTSDGTSFTPSTQGTDDLTDVSLLGTNYAYASAKGSKVISSADAGQTWTNNNPTSTTNLYGISAQSTALIYAVGDAGKIYRYNGTWQSVTDIAPPVLKSTYHVPSSNVCYAVGNGGTILKSTDNATTWNALSSGITTYLSGVFFTTVNNGYVIGASGTLRQTTDGGATWTSVATGTTNVLNHIFFTDANHGYVVGNGGILIRYTSAGWQAPQTIAAENLTSVYFVNNTGYAVGDNATIRKSSDYGATWITKTQSNTNHLNDVYFRDEKTGYATGDNGVILKTTDGGETWATHTTTPPNDLNAIAFGGQYTGFIAGSGAGNSLNDEADLFSQNNYYDKLGRLIASQNAKQYNKSPKAYSYTTYDALGRINQVGEVATNTPIPATGLIDQTEFTTWLAAGAKTQVTNTLYDAPAGLANFIQENLRSRVSSVNIDEDGNSGNGYDYATYYSYDIHGNVKSLLQDNPSLTSINQQYKRIDYDYDLVSGNVKKVSYQTDKEDQFYHQYEYDADNRITNVLTSKDGVIWDNDARYNYYAHGPLARTELGDQKVQGLDYAYTIQGWIKGVNSNTLKETRDIGKDGNAVGNINKYIARDAFGYSLNYFNGDYSPVVPLNVTQNFTADASAITSLASDAPNLYNGNIKEMVTAITDPTNNNAVIPQLTAYKYDQLNRIKQMKAYRDINLTTNVWNTTYDGSYDNTIAYDANGNITTNLRNGVESSGLAMDDMNYKYYNKANGYSKNTNRLAYVTDLAPAGTYSVDIDNQLADNYTYDEIGNLTHDTQEQIQNIEWTVYGKVKKVTRTSSSTKPNLEFKYDGSGNRVAKIVKPSATLSDPNTYITTHYVHDASGNTMATYEQQNQVLTLKEQHLYGSSRLGVLTRNIDLSIPPAATNIYTRILGKKQYELANHLGNVLTTVSDRKLAVVVPAPPPTGTNQDFNGVVIPAGWSTQGGSVISISNNRLQIANSSVSSITGHRIQNGSLAPGDYSLTFDLAAASSTTVKCRVWDVDDGFVLLKEETYNVSSSSTNFKLDFTTISGSTLIDFYSTTGTTFYVDNMKDIPEEVYYTANVTSATDYGVWGDPLPGRSFSSSDYRYGFNGMEKTDEWNGVTGANYDYGFRIYDPRLGKFLSPDPDERKYPFQSTYVFAENSPIRLIDVDGRGAGDSNDKKPKDTGTDKSKDNTLDPKSLNQNLFGSNYTGLNNPKNINGTENLVTAPPIDESDKFSQGHDQADATFSNRTAQGFKADATFLAGQAGIVAKSIENQVVIPYVGANPNKDAVTKQPYSGATTGTAAFAGAALTVSTAAKIILAVTYDPAVKVYNQTVTYFNDIGSKTTQGLSAIDNWFGQ